MQRRRPEQRDDPALRSGLAALGAIFGMAVGFVLAMMFARLSTSTTLFALAVFGTSAVGGVMGYCSARAGSAFVEWALHFLMGVAAWIVVRLPQDLKKAPTWLVVALFMGFGAAAVISLGGWR